MNKILEVQDLNISLMDKKNEYKAVEQLSFSLERGTVLGIIGESGSGKSISCLSILGLLEKANWNCTGRVLLNGSELPFTDRKAMRPYRDKDIALVMQNPMSAFNPVMTIERHFEETLMAHTGMSKPQIRTAAIDTLTQMRIKDPDKVYRSYPFECSGGILQRVMIAIALIMEPEVLIADEPTTALDLTVQFEILKLINEMRNKHNTAVILVSHDLNVIAEIADEIAVMYSGYIVEQAPAKELLTNPVHPYTKGLLRARPAFSKDRLFEIQGQPKSLSQRDSSCMFAERCPYRCEECATYNMGQTYVAESHYIRCCAKELNIIA